MRSTRPIDQIDPRIAAQSPAILCTLDLMRQLPSLTFSQGCLCRFSVFYVLNAASDGWLGGVGFVTEDIIKEHLPAPAQDVLVVQCGPPAMNKAMRAALDALGYTREMQFEF